MAREPSSDGVDPHEVQARFREMIAGLDREELGQVAAQLMDLAGVRARERLAPPRPERRRPRRTEDVTYRVRVDLTDTTPPVWRRLEVSSQIFLDELHLVLQTAFGWTDSHLHRFASGGGAFDADAQLYLCPFDVEEGEDDGVPEQDVRLDEVLAVEGDTLHYEYDYGDGWEHLVRLEAALDRAPDVPRARCTDGRRAGPPEDCGGAPGYAELVASGEVDGEAFDPAEVNASLSVALALADLARIPGPVGVLVHALGGDLVQHEVAQLVREARLDEPVEIAPADAAVMVQRVAWLLDRVGDKGLRLTAAGYLPPAVVSAAWTELDIAGQWYGKGNREVEVRPLLELRQAATRLGLLRKHRGDLLLTKRGAALRQDPVALWWHVAGRLAPGDLVHVEDPATVVLLLGVAAGRRVGADAFDRLLTDVLAALGWGTSSGGPLPFWAGPRAASETMQLLRNLHAVTRSDPLAQDTEPTTGGLQLARAALASR